MPESTAEQNTEVSGPRLIASTHASCRFLRASLPRGSCLPKQLPPCVRTCSRSATFLSAAALRRPASCSSSSAASATPVRADDSALLADKTACRHAATCSLEDSLEESGKLTGDNMPNHTRVRHTTQRCPRDKGEWYAAGQPVPPACGLCAAASRGQAGSCSAAPPR